jgi:hypothetical protein
VVALAQSALGFVVGSFGACLILLARDLGVARTDVAWLPAGWGAALLVAGPVGPRLLARGGGVVLRASAAVLAAGTAMVALSPALRPAQVGAVLLGTGGAGIVLATPALLGGPAAAHRLSRVNALASLAGAAAPLLLSVADLLPGSGRLALLLPVPLLARVATRRAPRPLPTRTPAAAPAPAAPPTRQPAAPPAAPAAPAGRPVSAALARAAARPPQPHAARSGAIRSGSTATGGRAAGDGATGNATTRGGTTGNAMVGDATTGDATTGNATTGNATTGNATTGNATTGNATTGNATTGNATTGNATTGDGTTRDATVGDGAAAGGGWGSRRRRMAAAGVLAAWSAVVLAVTAEFAFGVWAAARLQDSGLAVPAAAAGAAAYPLGMAAGRFAAGRLLGRVPAVAVSTGLVLTAAVALASPAGPVACVAALALAGLGIAALYPVTLAALMHRPGLAGPRAAALGATASGTAVLAGPLLVNAVAGMATLRTAFLAVIPLQLALLALHRGRTRTAPALSTARG